MPDPSNGVTAFHSEIVEDSRITGGATIKGVVVPALIAKSGTLASDVCAAQKAQPDIANAEGEGAIERGGGRV